MENTKHSKGTNTLASAQRSIGDYSTIRRCTITRSRFNSSRRYC